MNTPKAGTKRRWAWAAGGAALGTVLLFALFGLSRAPTLTPTFAPARPRGRLAIDLTERREKSALDDEATLLDPTPLFQPTRWSTAQMSVGRPESSGTFQNYRVPAHWLFAENELRLAGVEPKASGANADGATASRASLDLPPPVAMPAKPADALEAGMPGPILVGFGRTDQPLPSLPSRGAIVDIVVAGTGHAALSAPALARIQALSAGARPPAARPWQAMEFLAVVDPAGLVAPPTVTARSGVEEVDAYFQNFLARTLRLGERLGPGFYRISVGP
jgi:hypothetical protein